MAQLARELKSGVLARLEADARTARPGFKGAPTTQGQEHRRAAMRENKVFLRGRFTQTGAEVWDVVKVSQGESSLYAAGLLYVEEAAELAVQCMRGRVFVSIGGARALLAAGQHGVASPLHDVNPLSPRVTLVPQDGRDLRRSRLIEVQPGGPAKTEIVLASR